ncbi:MAG: glycosyltransferase family 9 protein [Bacteroidales bacterium]
MEKRKKILFIRFSSIGDIVLTTPVIRCLKKQTGAEVHYLTKEQFEPVLRANPFIDKIHTITRGLSGEIKELRSLDVDHIVDLHKNLRSMRVKASLHKPSTSFNKINPEKWLLVNFKIDRLPDVHIVERYFRAVETLGVKNDGEGLDYFIPGEDMVMVSELPETHREGYVAFVIGGKHKTKIFPEEKVISVIRKLRSPVVLLGGSGDRPMGDRIARHAGTLVYNACGKYNINQSASLMIHASVVITNDTGLMHIAAALRKPVVSVWGNTVPDFGMYPYFPGDLTRYSMIAQVEGLSCRPCSKIGYQKCPRKHFKCMLEIDEDQIVGFVSEIQAVTKGL